MYAEGIKENLDFMRETEQIDPLNEGSVSLHVPGVVAG